MPKTKTQNVKDNGEAQSKPQVVTNAQMRRWVDEITANAQWSRSQFVSQFMDPRRDIDDECGYPKTENITKDSYRMLYDREPIATRVVQLMPRECWKTPPSVFETEDVNNVTEFETAWEELGNSLRGNSWFKGEEGNPIWEYLSRADKLSGVGSYGVLLLGLDDGLELNEPVDGMEKLEVGKVLGNPRQLLFLRAFDESLAEITRYEEDSTSARFGQPIAYNLSFSDPSSRQETSASGLSLTTQEVHWTRVIHLADNLESSEVLGVSRMRPVYNRLLDLRKLYGGSAEMYWKGAFPGISIESDPTLGGDTDIDTSSIKDTMEKYMNGLQRYMALIGVTAKSLAPQVVDPTPQIDTQLQAIAIELDVPLRILMGSERGELASSQDTKAWNSRVKGRQNSYVTPRVIVPFVDRLIILGVLPMPEEYHAVWPDLDALTDQEQAGVALTRTEAIAKYVQGGVEALVPPMEYLTTIHDIEQDEVEAILKSATEHIEEVDAKEAEAHDLERGEAVEDRDESHKAMKELQKLK